jgi:lipoprotein NlpD
MIKFNSAIVVQAVVLSNILLLAACSGGAVYAPVIERKTASETLPSSHRVVRGETLYSIAWRYGIDFKGLVSTNNITSPYTIYPGQQLLLRSSPTRAVNVAKKKPLKTVSKDRVKNRKPLGAVKPVSKKGVNSNVDANSVGGLGPWRWPIKGKVIPPFESASAVHKGVDIRGNLGEPVYAANSGKVVYSGSGLVGYGKLLIVKHDRQYLSAYGHNSQLLVREGEWVKAGQKIATVGDSGTDKVMLHFEIRRNGKPVNPLTLLK